MLSKSALRALSSLPAYSAHRQLSAALGMEFAFSVQPSFSPPTDPGEAGTEYFVQAMGALRLEEHIAVWALGNTAAVDTNPSKLTLQLAVLPSQVYAYPSRHRRKQARRHLPSERARGSPWSRQRAKLGRQRRAHAAGDVCWREAVDVGRHRPHEPGSPVLDGAAWFVIDVKNPSTGLQAAISSQGYVAGPEHSHLLYPAVAVTAGGHAAMVFTLTVRTFFPAPRSGRSGATPSTYSRRGCFRRMAFSAYFLRPAALGRLFPRCGSRSTARSGWRLK